MLELIINKELDKKTIMLVENGILVEKHEEHENHQRLEGNIYCGKVQSVLQGMQSAFIDIGDKRNTFIRLKTLMELGLIRKLVQFQMRQERIYCHFNMAAVI